MFKRKFSIGVLEIRFNLVVFLFVCLLAGALVRLGVWQLSRAAEKMEVQDGYTSLAGEVPATLDTVPLAGLEYDARQIQNQRVSLQGRYNNERSVFLVFQSFEDQVGYEIFTPFYNELTSETVLVSRGWTGAAQYETLVEALPDIEGEVTLTGQIYVHPASSQRKRNNPAELNWPLQVRYMNMEELAGLLEGPVYPYVVRLGPDQPGVLVRYWPEVAAETGQHYSYALQWFSMAIAVLLVSLILSSNISSLLQQRFGQP